MPTAPYFQYSKTKFGSYFYNVNSTFYVWYDSWEEAKAGTAALGDTINYPNLPVESIPSARKYFKEHTFSQIVNRIDHGRKYLSALTFTPKDWSKPFQYGYAKYIAIGLLLLSMQIITNKKMALTLFKDYFWESCLFALAILGYLVLIFWYTSIAPGNRFLLALFLPLLFFVILAFHTLGKHNAVFNNLSGALLLIYLLHDITITLNQRIYYVDGGP